MKKSVVFAQVDQNKTTHSGICIAEAMSFEDLIQVDEGFKDSAALAKMFSLEAVKTVFVVLYQPLGATELRRKIAGAVTELDEAGIRKNLQRIMVDLHIDLVFHTKDQLKKLLPLEKEDREHLKRLLGVIKDVGVEK